LVIAFVRTSSAAISCFSLSSVPACI
jgi:hypothetical protein